MDQTGGLWPWITRSDLLHQTKLLSVRRLLGIATFAIILDRNTLATQALSLTCSRGAVSSWYVPRLRGQALGQAIVTHSLQYPSAGLHKTGKQCAELCFVHPCDKSCEQSLCYSKSNSTLCFCRTAED
jgi:hypothetical protein